MNIWTNGCFDVLHIGHIKLFEYAKSLGDKLYVGIDSDDRVKRLKGPRRPINNQYNRQQTLSCIKYIDNVDIFDSDNALKNFIKTYNIDIIVVGDEYKNTKVIGSDYAEVIFFPKIPNISSSYIIQQLI